MYATAVRGRPWYERRTTISPAWFLLSVRRQACYRQTLLWELRRSILHGLWRRGAARGQILPSVRWTNRLASYTALTSFAAGFPAEGSTVYTRAAVSSQRCSLAD